MKHFDIFENLGVKLLLFIVNNIGLSSVNRLFDTVYEFWCIGNDIAVVKLVNQQALSFFSEAVWR
jgi:hypothetical protein